MTPFTKQAHEIKQWEAAETVHDLNTPSIAEEPQDGQQQSDQTTGVPLY